MKAKNLIILVVAAAVLVWLAHVSSSRRAQSTQASAAIGTHLLPALQDTDKVNSIDRIVIRSPSSTVTVARVNNVWVAPGKYDYPVKFDRLDEFVHTISDLKIGQVMPGGESALAELQLQTPSPGPTNETADMGTLVQLEDKDGADVASFIAGKEHKRAAPTETAPPGFGGYPDGRYVAVDGKPYLVADALSSLPTSEKDWLDTDILNVTSYELASLTVRDGEGRTLTLEHPQGSTEFKVPDLATNEEMNVSKVNSLAGTLNYLTFTDVANPKLTDKALGFDKPTVVVAKALNDRVFTLTVGGSPTNSADRYVRVSVAYTPPPEAAAAAATNAPPLPEVEKKKADEEARQKKEEHAKIVEEVKTLNAKIAKWTYVIPSYKLEGVSAVRADFVKPKETPKAATPGATTPATTTEATPHPSAPPPATHAAPPPPMHHPPVHPRAAPTWTKPANSTNPPAAKPTK